jgi:hypothetical protein
MGTQARKRAEALFDASRNLGHELDILRAAAATPWAAQGPRLS